MCQSGQPHHCLKRSALGIKDKDGAFAEYLTTPVENLIEVPDSLEDNLAVFEQILNKVNVRPDQVEINGTFVAFEKNDLEKWTSSRS